MVKSKKNPKKKQTKKFSGKNSSKKKVSNKENPSQAVKTQYNKSWAFIKESKKHTYIILAIFAIFMVAGSLLPVPEMIGTNILEYFNQVENTIENMDFLELSSFIFSNNLQASFFGIIFGLFLGVIPILISASNGYIIGFVMRLAIEKTNIFVIWRIIPHGIFELPAIFLSLGLGLKISTFIIKKNKVESLKEYLINSLRVFLLIVVPLLIIAALVETSLIFFL